MHVPLLLIGPPAAGKSTTALAVARSSSLGAMIDVDDLRHLVVAGHAAPWDGDQGRVQQRIGVDNACDLARRFLAARIDVVIADFVTAQTVLQYRRNLPALRIVRLRLPLAEARRRAQLRPVHLSDHEFDALHALDAESAFPVDDIVDVASLDPHAQSDTVRGLWRSAPSRPGNP